MKWIIVVLVLIFLYGNQAEKQKKQAAQFYNASEKTTEGHGGHVSSHTNNEFKCDGRVYCSNMTSCEEAKFFLQHCPGVKMDGNNDGVPCERQWCH